jgi:hypothetical protein
MQAHSIEEMMLVLYQKGLVDNLERSRKEARAYWERMQGTPDAESPHTAAPWHNFGYIIHHNGQHIAHVVSKQDTPENRANAHLIAAAPDLLQSAKAALQALVAANGDEVAIADLRAAIVKATQESCLPYEQG